MLIGIRSAFKYTATILFVVSITGCLNYMVDASASKQFSPLINRCFVAARPLKIVKHETDRHFIELCPGNSGPGLIQVGSIEAGSKIILRRVTREHIGFYGDLHHGIVEFEFQGKTVTAEAFTIFLVKGEFAPNAKWLIPCT